MGLFAVATRYCEQLAAGRVHASIMDDNGGTGLFLHFIDNLPAMADDHANAAARYPHFERGREGFYIVVIMVVVRCGVWFWACGGVIAGKSKCGSVGVCVVTGAGGRDGDICVGSGGCG